VNWEAVDASQDAMRAAIDAADAIRGENDVASGNAGLDRRRAAESTSLATGEHTQATTPHIDAADAEGK